MRFSIKFGTISANYDLMIKMKILFFFGVLLSTMMDLHAQTPLFIVQENHTGPINALDIAPDGRWFATSGYDNQVHIWDMESGLLVQGFALYEIPNAIQFQQDPDIIYAGTHGIITSPMIGMDMRTYSIYAMEQHSVYSMERSKTFRFQAIGHNKGFISFFDNETEQSKYLQLDSAFAVSSMAFSSDEKWFAAGTSEFFGENELSIFDTKKQKRTFSMHSDSIQFTSLHFIDESEILIYSSNFETSKY